MYEDLIVRRDELLSSLEGQGTKDRVAIMSQLTQLNRMLEDEEFVEDALIDEWERQIEAGEVPDLEADGAEAEWEL